MAPETHPQQPMHMPAMQVPTCQRLSSSAQQNAIACPDIPASCTGIWEGEYAQEAARLQVGCTVCL